MINEILNGIKDAINTAIPELRRCEVHGGRFDLAELKRIATQTPAVFVSVLGIPTVKPKETQECDLELSLGIYIVTSERPKLPRHVSINNIVETLLVLIPINDWGFKKISEPETINAQNLYSGEVDKHGIAMWAISFKQRIRVGNDIFVGGIVPTQLYVGTL